MSGGHWDYNDRSLKIDIFGWREEGESVPNVFEDKEVSELIYDVFELLHDFDWYKSGDTGKSDYVKSKQAFKKKWLKDNTSKERRKHIIDESIEDLRKELYETFDVGTEEAK